MLTVQSIRVQQPNLRKVSFGEKDYTANENVENPINDDGSDEFKKISKDIDELEKDSKTPKFLKPFLKVLKAVSEGFVEGFAVVWATKKSAIFTKGIAGKIAKGSIGKNTSKLFGFAKHGLQKLGQIVMKGLHFITNTFKTGAKTKPVYETIAKKSTQLKENKFVKPVIDFVEKRMGSLKAVGKKVADKCKSATFEGVVDKSSKVAGAGCGAASVVANVVNKDTPASVGEEE